MKAILILTPFTQLKSITNDQGTRAEFWATYALHVNALTASDHVFLNVDETTRCFRINGAKLFSYKTKTKLDIWKRFSLSYTWIN